MKSEHLCSNIFSFFLGGGNAESFSIMGKCGHSQCKTLTKETENKLKRMTWQNRYDYSMRLLLCLKMKTYSTKLQSAH